MSYFEFDGGWFGGMQQQPYYRGGGYIREQGPTIEHSTRNIVLARPSSSDDDEEPEFMRWAFRTSVVAPSSIDSEESSDEVEDNQEAINDDYAAPPPLTEDLRKRDPRFARRTRALRRIGASQVRFTKPRDRAVLRITRRLKLNNGFLSFSQVESELHFFYDDLDAQLQMLSSIPDENVRRNTAKLGECLNSVLNAYASEISVDLRRNSIDLLCNKTGRLWLMVDIETFYANLAEEMLNDDLGYLRCDGASRYSEFEYANLNTSVSSTLIFLQRLSSDWHNEAAFIEHAIKSNVIGEWFESHVIRKQLVSAVLPSLFVDRSVVLDRLTRRCATIDHMSRVCRNAFQFMLSVRDLPIQYTFACRHETTETSDSLRDELGSYVRNIFNSSLSERALGVLLQCYGVNSVLLLFANKLDLPYSLRDVIRRYVYKVTWYFISTYMYKCRCCAEPVISWPSPLTPIIGSSSDDFDW